MPGPARSGLPWPYPSTGRPARGLPGALLYTEMHYRWWPLPSRYFRKEPELLADAPRRVEPGRALPLLLLVKDAHRYPITLERVTVEVETPDGGVGLAVEQDEPFDPPNIRRNMLDLSGLAG